MADDVIIFFTVR